MRNESKRLSVLSYHRKSFTLLELTIVIVVIGILALIGIVQYVKICERARGAEARMILKRLGETAYEIYSATGHTDGDYNIGQEPGQYPATCKPTHYFRYSAMAAMCAGASCPNPIVIFNAERCDKDGKSPQGVAGNYLRLTITVKTGKEIWASSGGY